jgi:hypothetical protein
MIRGSRRETVLEIDAEGEELAEGARRVAPEGELTGQTVRDIVVV